MIAILISIQILFSGPSPVPTDTIQSVMVKSAIIFDESAHRDGGHRWLEYSSDIISVTHGSVFYVDVYIELLASGAITTTQDYILFTQRLSACGVTVRNVIMLSPQCWGEREVAHEIVHLMGGVSPNAPHGYGRFGHCFDEYDAMCYDDGSAPVVIQYDCPQSGELLLDCNGDDYYNVNPPPDSWLAANPDANRAYSEFLLVEHVGMVWLPIMQN